ncbi:MAG: energy transducer TonB [bacterium]|nr:energy transducer TonB [bacterium]
MIRPFPLSLVLLGVLLCLSCAKKTERYLLVSEVAHFEIQGDGKSLNLPLFAGTLRVEEILRDVKLAEYYYQKLSPVYDFKAFTFVGSCSRETLLDRAGELHAPQPVYEYEDSLARLDLSLIAFDENAATYVFRITDKLTGHVRDHEVTVPAGKSASVGGLFDREHNRGHLISISTLSLPITKTLEPAELADFLSTKNTPRGEAKSREFSPGDQKWMDELFGAGTYELSMKKIRAADAPVEFDTPPAPVGGMGAIGQNIHYPAAAREDGIEGEVIVEVSVNETGQVGDLRLLRGVRADLDSAAMTAVSGVAFHPAMSDGKPIAVRVAIPIRFRLNP